MLRQQCPRTSDESAEQSEGRRRERDGAAVTQQIARSPRRVRTRRSARVRGLRPFGDSDRIPTVRRPFRVAPNLICTPTRMPGTTRSTKMHTKYSHSPPPRHQGRAMNRRNREFALVWPSFRSLAHFPPSAPAELFARTICAAAAAQRADRPATSASASSLWRARLFSALRGPQ